MLRERLLELLIAGCSKKQHISNTTCYRLFPLCGGVEVSPSQKLKGLKYGNA